MMFIKKIFLFSSNGIAILRKKLCVEKDTKTLGRWNIDYDLTKMNTKIDYSNYDHCGSCGLTKISDVTKNHPTSSPDADSFPKAEEEIACSISRPMLLKSNKNRHCQKSSIVLFSPTKKSI